VPFAEAGQDDNPRRRQLGFETVQFRKYPPADGNDLLRLLDAGKDAGFDWVCLNLLLVAEKLEQGLDLEALVDACRRLEFPVRMVQSMTVSADEDRDAWRVALLTRLVRAFRPRVIACNFMAEPGTREINRFRSQTDTLLAVEPTLRFAIEFGPYWPVEDIKAAQLVAERIGDDRTGLLVDTWHFFHGPSRWEELERIDPDRLFAVQLNDCVTRSDDLVRGKEHRALPGQGSFELDRFVATLTDNGYDGLVSPEVINADLAGMTSRDYARLVHTSAARYWS
jgi:sugar phosphate isomerase/epimerase